MFSCFVDAILVSLSHETKAVIVSQIKVQLPDSHHLHNMFISTFLMHSPFAQTVHYSFTFSFTLPSYLLRSMIHQGEQLAPGNLSLVENVRLKYELYCARAPCMQIKYCLKTLSQYLAIVVTLSRGLSS